MTKNNFYKKDVLSSNPNFEDPVVEACKNKDKLKVKLDIQVYLYSNVVTINNKKTIKFCLTMATKRSHKEVILKTKYEAFKELEERRTKKYVCTSTLSTSNLSNFINKATNDKTLDKTLIKLY